jgi:hypothetical protein
VIRNLIKLAVVVGIAALVVQLVPDVARYMKIRQM